MSYSLHSKFNKAKITIPTEVVYVNNNCYLV